MPALEKTTRLADPVVTAGDRLYAIGSQNGLFPDSWGGHVPNEMWGIWAHPIKLLDGFWLGLVHPSFGSVRWLAEAELCRVSPGYTEFEYSFPNLRVSRRDFAPDGLAGLVVSLRVTTTGTWPEGMHVRASFTSDLRPAWLGERAGWRDTPDRVAWRTTDQALIFRDRDNPWFAAIGADVTATDIVLDQVEIAFQRTAGQGACAGVSWPLTGDGQLTFFIAGSAQSEDEALETLRRLRAEHTALFRAKQATYHTILDTCALDCPDAGLNRAFAWSKVNCQMLARDVPGLGHGVGAGLPVYPWWFGIDIEYAALPMLQAGLFNLTQDSLRLLHQASLAANPDQPGRVIHELTTTGVVFNNGNLVEAPAFVRAVHQYWLWTGDSAWVRELYPFCKQALLEYTLGRCDPDGDLCPSGRSIIETPEMHAGLECIDVTTYTCEALAALGELAQIAGDTAILPELRRRADELAERIRREWWLEQEGLFADVRASKREVNELLTHLEQMVREQDWLAGSLEQAQIGAGLFTTELARHAGAPDEVDLPWLLRHWIILCPLEAGLASEPQAAHAFTRLESAEFCNEWGMKLHPDRRDVMSINTGLLALAEARYGRLEQALGYVRKLADVLAVRTPGAISEALPDQWCFLQLWSALGVISPIVEGVFGIAPRAAEKRLRVIGNLPATWPQASLRHVRVGAATVDVTLAQNETERRIQVVCSDPAYTFEMGWVVPAGIEVVETRLNNYPAEWRLEPTRSGSIVVCGAQSMADLTIRLAKIA
ncbi:MAG: hypothetical protein RMN25_00290 [Anaerolineae bacterium]|nr:hypothetical protein [Thermoflexales bacterium]MDW8406198.1 hypothetical protein [Anaerolineae bacterium]